MGSMEFYFEKARLFALETAKKSQEVATQAAKLSQDLATETAKRSKELAIDVSKRADQLKAYAEELTPNIVVQKAAGGSPAPSEKEVEEYGITADFREFVKGLTIKTFRDFPLDATHGLTTALSYTGSELSSGGLRAGDSGGDKGKQVLTPWRERHAVLVLLTVKEISDFRYVLCPRRMTESQFWAVYFSLVKTQIVEYEAAANEKVAALAQEEEKQRLAQASGSGVVAESRNFEATPTHPGQEEAAARARLETGPPVTSKTADHELDAYLMGALESSDEGADGDDDLGFDADFDQLVNSAAGSDVEDDSAHADSTMANTKSKLAPSSSNPKPVAGSELSSDGELVEIPDSECEQAHRASGAEKSK